MRLQGRFVQDGKPVALDITLVGTRGGQGRITVGGLTFQVVRLGELLWFKAPRAFYRQQPTLPVDLLADRWLEAPAASGQFAQFAAFTRGGEFAEQLLSSPDELSAEPTTLAGGPATALSTPRGRLIVSTTEPVRPLRAEGRDGSGDALVFGSYGAPVDLRKPVDVVTAAQVAAAQGR